MTGPGYAATTSTSTPKSLSFFSIRRDVNSSVSAPTRFLDAAAIGSSSDSGRQRRNRPTGRVNSGCCFSRSTRSGFRRDGLRALDQHRRGFVAAHALHLRTAWSVRTALAAAPMHAVLSRRRGLASRGEQRSDECRRRARPRTATRNGRTGDRPIASISRNSSVAPVKPSASCNQPAEQVADHAARRRGSRGAQRVHADGLAGPMLATSPSRPKPMPADRQRRAARFRHVLGCSSAASAPVAAPAAAQQQHDPASRRRSRRR